MVRKNKIGFCSRCGRKEIVNKKGLCKMCNDYDKSTNINYADYMNRKFKREQKQKLRI